MAIITFWNNNTGKIGQTHSILAIATFMAIEHNYKILLISTRMNDDVSMQAYGIFKSQKKLNFLDGNRMSMDLESGIESVAKLSSSNRLTPDSIQNYTKMIFRNRLEVLSGPRGADYKKTYEACPNIVSVAKRFYDLVFVDLNNGYSDEITKEILNKSDIIITNIEQKPSELMQIQSLRSHKIISDKNSLLLFNRYDRDSKYSIKNSTRFLGDKKEMLSIPYSSIFAEAIQEGNLADFFMNPRIRKLDNTEDKNGFFISEIKRAVNAIIYKLQELQMKL